MAIAPEKKKSFLFFLRINLPTGHRDRETAIVPEKKKSFLYFFLKSICRQAPQQRNGHCTREEKKLLIFFLPIILPTGHRDSETAIAEFVYYSYILSSCLKPPREKKYPFPTEEIYPQISRESCYLSFISSGQFLLSYI